MLFRSSHAAMARRRTRLRGLRLTRSPERPVGIFPVTLPGAGLRRLGLRKLGLAALLLGGLAGCSMVTSPAQMRGHRIESDMLKELTPGTSTKADVVALLGSPTKRDSFDDNIWIYIASVTRMQIARRPGLESQEIGRAHV